MTEKNNNHYLFGRFVSICSTYVLIPPLTYFLYQKNKTKTSKPYTSSVSSSARERVRHQILIYLFFGEVKEEEGKIMDWNESR